MKKKTIIAIASSIVVLILLIVVCVLLSHPAKPTEEKKEANQENIAEKVKNVTKEKQGDFIVKDISIKKPNSQNVVSGTVTSKASETKSITIELTMTDSESGKLYGIQNIDVDDIQPKETRKFSVSIMGDYSHVDTFEVKVSEK